MQRCGQVQDSHPRQPIYFCSQTLDSEQESSLARRDTACRLINFVVKYGASSTRCFFVDFYLICMLASSGAFGFC